MLALHLPAVNLSAGMPVPLYSAHNLNPAYLLRYSWAAFPAKGELLPADPPGGLFDLLSSSWEADGIRLLEHRWGAQRIQATFSTTPQVAPDFLAARAKGRLQHALRRAGVGASFARNFSVRALGNNTRETVEIQNNLAWQLGQVRVWESNYYAGTTGEYTMHAVRS